MLLNDYFDQYGKSKNLSVNSKKIFRLAESFTNKIQLW